MLREVPGLPFHVVKSGTQSGTDVRSEPYNLVSMAQRHLMQTQRMTPDEVGVQHCIRQRRQLEPAARYQDRLP